VKISEVTKILGAEVLFGENLLDQEITEFAASDLLSDILTFTKKKAIFF